MPKPAKPRPHANGRPAPRGVPATAADSFAEPTLRALLQNVRAGKTSIDAALSHLRHFPFEQTGDATLDHHRRLRKGFSEVIYCAGKTPLQVADIAEKLAAQSPRLLGTRATVEHFSAAHDRLPELRYDALARVIWMDNSGQAKRPGVIVIAAGTSDLAVAEEAALTLEVMGHAPTRIRDVGVAGLHRLLSHLPELMSARVVVAVAGMEGALPSVIAGLISAPVIAVPTSVGYGASFGGIAALLAMLNSCASGLAVVNIDNGFGAGYMAAAINSLGTAAGESAPGKSAPLAKKNRPAPRAAASLRAAAASLRTAASFDMEGGE